MSDADRWSREYPQPIERALAESSRPGCVDLQEQTFTWAEVCAAYSRLAYA